MKRVPFLENIRTARYVIRRNEKRKYLKIISFSGQFSLPNTRNTILWNYRIHQRARAFFENQSFFSQLKDNEGITWY